ncbi:DNA polymerase III subunit epsilon [Amorphus orientalis]|uniref:DNA polymerase III subunit epsilon n=1 Tax=Amorphus orientalis TaxID=649198 RepID=A0AAE4AS63_9HYPH|nr:DNA polymerase III subunit epsilon [Amorphus orientalis]MDQ0313724.1 DNA polymerase-3 subunit epsilon [Amorphus orientalis]
MREIVLDTETTGLNPKTGDRLVEIGAVELVNHIPSGQHFHVYINPERDVPDEAFRVHGLSTDFLRDKPVFAAVVESFLEFIGDDPLVIHNADFDMGFINWELGLLKRMAIGSHRVVDTLALARRKHPGGGNSLDALCSRYGIDNSRREKHGALLDSELLAEVYLELIGGRQAALTLVSTDTQEAGQGSATFGERKPVRARPTPLAPRISEDDLAAHAAFVEKLGPDSIWQTYQPGSAGDARERRA